MFLEKVIKSGRLTKHDLCAINGYGAIKTKTKKIRTHPHRAMGGFGAAHNYTVRDKFRMCQMDDDVEEYLANHETSRSD